MRGFIIICICATILAAPPGYSYNQQQNSFSVGLSTLNKNAHTATITKIQNNHGFLQQAVDAGQLPQALIGGDTISHKTQQFSTTPNFSKLQPATQHNVGINSVQQQQQQGPPITNFGGQHQQFNTIQQQLHQQQQQQHPAVGTITKDIFVHVPPEDVHNQQYQQQVLPAPPPPPRKHYRIVFIKAPTQNINNAALSIQQAPIEEKTIIYVLTKKHDPLDLQTAIQEVQPKQPTKPEVYFIKYKTQEEAQHAQHLIQAQYEQLGGSSQVSDGGIAPVASVVGSLDGTQQQRALEFSNKAGNSLPSASSSSSFTSSRTANIGSKYLPAIKKL